MGRLVWARFAVLPSGEAVLDKEYNDNSKKTHIRALSHAKAKQDKFKDTVYKRIRFEVREMENDNDTENITQTDNIEPRGTSPLRSIFDEHSKKANLEAAIDKFIRSHRTGDFFDRI